MNINSVDNSFHWSGARKTESMVSKAGSFASKLNVAKKSKDVISDDEKRRAGYNGTVVKQVDSMADAYYSEEPVVDNFIDGNVLAFTRSQGSLVYSNPLAFNEETKGLYRKITAIFERMLQENS